MFSIDEINNLEKMYENSIKQYNVLLKKYKEVLKLSKENADSYECCLRELEVNIDNLSRDNEKLKDEILNIRGQNIQYEIALKEIKQIAKNNIELGIIIPGGWLEQRINEVLKSD